MFTELKNRGVQDVLIAVCDSLKGFPEAINRWVQQCIVHLIRNSFRYGGPAALRRHRPFAQAGLHDPERGCGDQACIWA